MKLLFEVLFLVLAVGCACIAARNIYLIVSGEATESNYTLAAVSVVFSIYNIINATKK